MHKMLALVLAVAFPLPLLPAAISQQDAHSGIAEVKTYGGFETAGIIVKVLNMDFDETVTIEYRKAGESGTIAFDMMGTIWRRACLDSKWTVSTK